MKTLYLECNMGAAGDMLTAALLDLLPAGRQQEFLRVMNAIPGVSVRAEQREKCGVQGLHVTVEVNGQEEQSRDVPCGTAALPAHQHDHEHVHDHEHGDGHEHGHEHSHGHGHHHHAGMAQIEAMIDGLPMPRPVKEKAKAVYALIAEAESHAHGCLVSEVHFHEVGAMDAVADVAGACLLLHWLAPDRVVASPVHLGSGQVRCAHGVLPVPAPATAYLLQGVPCYGGAVQGELCTPTGAALLKSFAAEFGPMPPMTLRAAGVGVGSKDFAQANILRAFAGESGGEAGDEVAELCCNLDDMTGEALAYAQQRLLEAGALDVYTLPLQMKKGRPGVMLCCLCRPGDQERMTGLLLKHTTTWGVRAARLVRTVQPRAEAPVETPYGTVRVKYAAGGPGPKQKAEYADAAAAAEQAGVPLCEVQRAAIEAFEKQRKPE